MIDLTVYDMTLTLCVTMNASISIETHTTYAKVLEKHSFELWDYSIIGN
jgi:hypothetical protein